MKGSKPKVAKIEFALKSVLHRDGRQLAYQRQNEHYRDNYVIESNPQGGGSVMIWGGIPFNTNRALTRILKTGVQDSHLAKSRSPTGKIGSPTPKKLESHQFVHTVYLFHFSRK